MIHPRRSLRNLSFTLNGYIGRKISIDGPQKVTILLTYYHPARMIHIDSVVRNFLSCTFVDKIVITNHNPEIKIQNKVKLRDERLILINQDIQRGSGYRWQVASAINSDYFIVIDDDIFLFPSQLKNLFEHLLSEPLIPHGYAGQLHLNNDTFEYREREDAQLDYLCELYAVTKAHVKRFSEIEQCLLEQDKTLYDFVEQFADYIVISQSGAQNPKIHKTDRLLRSDTFKTPGIAAHKGDSFAEGVIKVCHTVKEIQTPTLVCDPLPTHELVEAAP